MALKAFGITITTFSTARRLRLSLTPGVKYYIVCSLYLELRLKGSLLLRLSEDHKVNEKSFNGHKLCSWRLRFKATLPALCLNTLLSPSCREGRLLGCAARPQASHLMHCHSTSHFLSPLHYRDRC